MLKLSDRVVLETSIRDAMGKFDAPFGYAEGFDRTTGEYAGLIYAKAARKSSPRKGSLFAPTLRSSKCRACRPLRRVRSPEGTAPRVRPDLLPARQALRRLRRLRSSRAGFYGSVEIDINRPVKAFDTILNSVVMELQKPRREGEADTGDRSRSAVGLQ